MTQSSWQLYLKQNLTVCLLLVGLLMLLVSCGGSKEIVLDSPASQTDDVVDTAMPASEISFNVVVLAHISAADTLERWRPILDYLQTETGYAFELWPTLMGDMLTTVQEEDVDFVVSNPLFSTQLRRLHNTTFLATNVNGVEGSEFGGVIIAREGSNINSVTDLPGKRGMSMRFEIAAGGYAYQTYLLHQHGIDPHTDFAEFTEASSQNDIVLAVANGTTDVGFVRTGRLERMAAAGLIEMEQFTIVEQIEDDHPYVHSTSLYPEWAVTAMPHIEPDVAAQVQAALIRLPADHPSIVSSNVVGFVEPLSYHSLDNLIETLKLFSWDYDYVIP